MKLLVYGAGGHGKVVADILLASGHADVAFLDDNTDLAGMTVSGIEVIGGADRIHEESAKGKIGVALGIGDNNFRKDLASRLTSLGTEIVTAIHPSAVVARTAKIGAGTVIMAGVVINPDSQLGCGVIANSGAVIEHDVVIGDYAHVSPNSVMGGASSLGSLSHLGLGAVVLPGIAIGSRSIIGGGAVVTREMPSDIVAIGVPARVR
jgi:sugar O-acyltransferase (sialic acid O-acetyltransferase NeuD family)